MDYWMDHVSRERRGTSRRQPVHTLKRCPLCGTLNAAENQECFTCSWHCSFDTNHWDLEESLFDLMDRCPSLTDFTPIRPKRRVLSRIKACVLRLFGRRLDLRL